MSTKQTTISYLNSLNTKKTMTYEAGNPCQVLAWDRHKNVAGLY